jgi:site-specific DNA-methyltransferase (adenine-specific)
MTAAKPEPTKGWTEAGGPTWKVVIADCREALRKMKWNSVDAIVSDPPYGLEFMGKEFDSLGDGPGQQAWHLAWAKEALLVLKPGGHLVAFGGSRTYHRLACALEDAGFEIRDSLMWIYGTGFPKSRDVGKAFDKKTPDLAKQWDGWGTALKPAFEPIVLARKPLEGTVIANIQKWGVGALNIVGTRTEVTPGVLGRWPTNVMLDEEAGTMLDKQSGLSTSPKTVVQGGKRINGGQYASTGGDTPDRHTEVPGHGDSGGASRFFYCAKTSRRERNVGSSFLYWQKKDKHTVVRVTKAEWEALDPKNRAHGNNHPTVKPMSLMRWLIKLVTPKDGLVLDPFVGSGSTGLAAARENVRFVGIEKDENYAAIARSRLEAPWQEDLPLDEADEGDDAPAEPAVQPPQV